MKWKKTIPLLLLLAGFLQPARAQLLFNIEKAATEQGLTDQRITCFLKDKYHYLWIGTKNGLNRYNGQRVERFLPINEKSISNEVVNDLEEDGDGNIWVATMNGLNCYNPNTNAWEVLRSGISPAISNALPNSLVWNILSDEGFGLWIASDGRALSCYDIRTKNFRHFPWIGFVEKMDPSMKGNYKSIIRILRGEGDLLWLATTIGVFSLNKKTGIFSWVLREKLGHVQDFVYDRATRKLLVSDENGRIFGYNIRLKIVSAYTILSIGNNGERYYSMHEQANWLGHPLGLALIAPGSHDTAYLLEARPSHPAICLSGAVTGVYRDDAGIRWMATSNGVNKYDPSIQQATFLPLKGTDPYAASNQMGGVALDPSGKKLFACSHANDLVVRIDLVTGNSIRYATAANGEKISKPVTVRRDAAGTNWLLCENSVYRFDSVQNRFVPFPLPKGKRPFVYRDVLLDAAGDIWFASFNGPVMRYLTKENRVEIMGAQYGFLSEGSSCLLSDTLRREVWVGTFSYGAYRFNLATRKAVLYTERKETPHYNGLFLVHDMTMDKNGAVWVATHSGGLYRGEPDLPYEKVFTPFTMKQGLPGNNFHAVKFDGASLWFLSGLGIGAVHPKGEMLYFLTPPYIFPFQKYASDLKMTNQIEVNATTGNVYAGVAGGILTLNTRAPQVKAAFPVVIESVKVDQQERWSGHTGNAPRSITLSKSPEQLIIQFAALTYSLPAKVSYEYRLNSDSAWIEIGHDNQLIFRRPEPGSFQLFVRAKDHTGNYSTQEAGFSLTIVPPYWKRIWFIALVLLLVATALYWWISSLLRKIHLEKTINRFATSLYGKNSVEEIFWEIARNCLALPGFKDCVIYQFDANRNVLVQKAACGPKNPTKREILNPIEIPVGSGIVGSVAASLKAERICDTRKDKRYIVDEQSRLSELAAPIVVDGQLFGVIDSEHPKKGFYTSYHEKLFTQVAALCSVRISRFLIEEQLRSKIARDLHDEMGSTLTSINILSKVAAQQINDQPALEKYLGRIRQYSSGLMESMSDIVWTINPANDTFGKLIIRMKELSAEILEPMQVTYHFSNESSVDHLKLNLEQRKNVYLIFKEGLNNMVKYSGGNEFAVNFYCDGKGFGIVLHDNGRSFDATLEYSGNGLKNMTFRAKELGGALLLESQPGKGTSISLQVPFT